MKNIHIYLLPTINFLTLVKNNKNYLYIYTNNWFIYYNINNFFINFKKSINLIELSNKLPITNSREISNILNNFIFSWELIFFKKITFTGKGFKIKKKQKIVYFFFNKSHLSLLICNKIIVKKINKQKILFFYRNNQLYNNILNKIVNIRFANIYTKRGLRFSRQLILKRKGKGGVQPQ